MFTRLIVSENRLGVNTNTCWKTLANNARRYSSRCVRAFTLKTVITAVAGSDAQFIYLTVRDLLQKTAK